MLVQLSQSLFCFSKSYPHFSTYTEREIKNDGKPEYRFGISIALKVKRYRKFRTSLRIENVTCHLRIKSESKVTNAGWSRFL